MRLADHKGDVLPEGSSLVLEGVGGLSLWLEAQPVPVSTQEGAIDRTKANGTEKERRWTIGRPGTGAKDGAAERVRAEAAPEPEPETEAEAGADAQAQQQAAAAEVEVQLLEQSLDMQLRHLMGLPPLPPAAGTSCFT